MPDWPFPLGRPVGSPSLSYAEVNHRKMYHDKAWVMGVLEPILLFLCIALIGALLGWL